MPKYLSMCLTAANLNRLSTGGAQPLINQQIVKAIEIPVPAVEEQREIVARFQLVLFAKIASCQRSNILDKFKQTILRGDSFV